MSQIVTSNLSYQIYQKGKKQAIVTNKMINERICAQEFAKHKEHKHKMLDVLYKHYRLPLPIPSNVFVSTKKDICNLTQTSSTLYSVQLFTSAQRLPILTWQYLTLMLFSSTQSPIFDRMQTSRNSASKVFKYLGEYHVEPRRKRT